MIYNLYSVFDTVDGCYGDLLLHRSDERASRTIKEQIAIRNEQLKQKGFGALDINELRLRKLGTFDDTNAKIDLLASPVEISLA